MRVAVSAHVLIDVAVEDLADGVLEMEAGEGCKIR